MGIFSPLRNWVDDHPRYGNNGSLDASDSRNINLRSGPRTPDRTGAHQKTNMTRVKTHEWSRTNSKSNTLYTNATVVFALSPVFDRYICTNDDIECDTASQKKNAAYD